MPVDLSAREADIALRVIFGNPQDDVIGVHVGELVFGIYGSKAYLAEHLDLDTAGTTVLGWLPEAGHTWIPEPFRPDWILREFPNASLGTKIDAMTVMISAIHQGMGICGLPLFVGEADPELELISYSPGNPVLSLWLLHHVDLRATSRVGVFRDFLKEILREIKPRPQKRMP